MIRAQQEAAHRFAEVGGAVDRQIVLGVLVRQDAVLGGFDRVQHRNMAGGILVDPHAQVQLLRIGVCVARGGEVVDRIGRGRLDVGEDVHETVRYTDGSGVQIEIGYVEAGRRKESKALRGGKVQGLTAVPSLASYRGQRLPQPRYQKLVHVGLDGGTDQAPDVEDGLSHFMTNQVQIADDGDAVRYVMQFTGG